MPTLWVPAARVHEVLRFLKSELTRPYRMLFDLTAVDERVRKHREGQPASDFTVIYHLISIDRKESVPTLAGRDRTTELRPTPLGAVDELLAGTTDEGEDDDYATAIPGNTGLLPESRAGKDIIVLDLSGEFANVAGDLSLQAYAQLVYTATQYDRSKPVRFQIEGKSVSAPTDEGQKDHVQRNDYLSLQPAP